jgi:tRNA-splicing ligase RtcB
MSDKWTGKLEKLTDTKYMIPRSYKAGMKTDGIIYADEQMLPSIVSDQAPEQVANVAFLPGLIGFSMAMPDIHWGYGFPIGGVAAFDYEEGVVSPGGIGYDINCGVRLLTTHLAKKDVAPKLDGLINQIFRDVPSGVGSEGRIRISDSEMDNVMVKGAKWAVEQGYGTPDDLGVTEEDGCIEGADPSLVGERARKRGRPQLGTLGSGNHFLEIQELTDVYDEGAARAMGLAEPGQVTVMIHTGSRGFGYQVCDDSLKTMQEAARRYRIELPDRQLACAPIQSDEGQTYLAQMRCAANYAWANRQAICHWVREAFERIFDTPWQKLGLAQVYDVAHNIAKIEEHVFSGSGEERHVRVLVHRKGATRAFGPGRPELPGPVRAIGQPVIVPGDMGTASYVMAGTDQAMAETFGSTCHGAGRVMSRKAAVAAARGRDVIGDLRGKGIKVRAASRGTVSEEMPEAYKDVDHVVDITHRAGISRKVAKMVPLAVVKG